MMKKIQLIIAVLVLTMNVSSQCFDDQHSTNWFDAWVACEPALNPNSVRGNSYWIQYDLGSNYTLGQTHFWNINDPAHKNYGLKNIIIDYSTDGVNWEEWGTHFLLQSSGLPTYEGLPGPDLDDIIARYVVITAVDNWGGACYGLSELKIEVSSSSTVPTSFDANCLDVEIYPNPAFFEAAMKIRTYCAGDVTYTIRNAFAGIIETVNIGTIYGKVKVALPIDDMSPGIYSVTVYQGPFQKTKHIVIL